VRIGAGRVHRWWLGDWRDKLVIEQQRRLLQESLVAVGSNSPNSPNSTNSTNGPNSSTIEGGGCAAEMLLAVEKAQVQSIKRTHYISRTIPTHYSSHQSSLTLSHQSSLTPVFSHTSLLSYQSSLTPVFSHTSLLSHQSSLTPVFSHTSLLSHQSSLTPVFSHTSLLSRESSLTLSRESALTLSHTSQTAPLMWT
jgi:hypothetical protein